ncbi:MAG: GntR family transcriptional regulator [Stappiaceae bacterium]
MTDQAYRELRDAIISLRIQPGEQLDTESIASSMGFSRAPIIEALNTLRGEGLIVSRRRVGTFVSEIGSERIEEVFDAREMIEQRVTPVVVHNVSDRQIDALGTILAEAGTLLDAKDATAFDYPRFMELDALFHTEFIRLSERKIYQKWFEELAAHMQRVRHLFDGNALERSIEGQLEHDAILTALRKRDVDELRAKLLNHTRRSRAGAAEILDKR